MFQYIYNIAYIGPFHVRFEISKAYNRELFYVY